MMIDDIPNPLNLELDALYAGFFQGLARCAGNDALGCLISTEAELTTRRGELPIDFLRLTRMMHYLDSDSPIWLARLTHDATGVQGARSITFHTICTEADLLDDALITAIDNADALPMPFLTPAELLPMLNYIDECARLALNNALDYDADLTGLLDPANEADYFETFQESIESDSAGLPITIFPDASTELTNLIYDAIDARIRQLISTDADI